MQIFKEKKILFGWRISFVIIFALPVIFSLLIHMQVERLLTEEINRSNLAVLDVIHASVEAETLKMKNLAVEIALSSPISQISEYELPSTAEETYNLNNFSQEMSIYFAADKNIDFIYTYFHKLDMVIGNMTKGNTVSFYDAFFGMTEESYEQWLCVLKNKTTSDFFTMPYLKSNNEIGTLLCYLIPVKDSTGSSIAASVVVAIDSSQIMNFINSDGKEKNGELIILDHDGTVVLSSADDVLTNEIQKISFNAEKEILYVQNNNVNYVVANAESEANHWRYIFAIPRNQYMKHITTSRVATLALLALCIVLGSIIIYNLIKKNYRPIQDITEMLTEYGLKNKNKNEFIQIRDSISEIVKQKVDAESKLMKQKKFLRDGILIKLLHGKYDGETSVRDIMRSFDDGSVDFVNDYFVVAIFYIENLENLFFEEGIQDDPDSLELAHIAISNITTEIVSKSFPCVSVEENNLLMCLINLKGVDVKEHLFELLDNSRIFLKDNFNISYITALGGIHYGMDGIAESYKEAYDCMEHKLIVGDMDYLDYDEIATRTDDNFYYPIEKEKQIINLIKAGDYEKSLNAINEVFDRNFNDIKLPLSISKCLLFDVASTIIKTTNEIFAMKDNYLFNKMYYFEQLLNCDTIYKMKEEIMKICKLVCEFIEENKRETNELLKERVEKYVEAYYDDQNLNVSSIAESLNMNIGYLSTVFKQQTGEGVLEYINKFRIEKSKVYMRDKNLTIEMVSKKVGYSSVRTFMRAFMRHEGMTPGKYREMNIK